MDPWEGLFGKSSRCRFSKITTRLSIINVFRLTFYHSIFYIHFDVELCSNLFLDQIKEQFGNVPLSRFRRTNHLKLLLKVSSVMAIVVI